MSRYGMRKSAGTIAGNVVVTGGDLIGTDPEADTKVQLGSSQAQVVVDSNVRVDARADSVELTTGVGQGLKVDSAGAALFASPLRSVTHADSPVTVSAATDAVIVVDTQGGAVTLNLPDPATVNAGRFFEFIDQGSAGSNSVTVADSTSGGKINGANSQTIDQDRGAFKVYCTGTQWLIGS